MRTRCTLSKSEKDAARADIRKILLRAPDEVVGVRDALVEGRIEGSVYNGERCCLVGTIARLRGISTLRQALCLPLERAIQYNEERPAERFFLNISAGDTPKTNGYSKLALKWIDEWIDEQAAKITSSPVELQVYSLTT